MRACLVCVRVRVCLEMRKHQPIFLKFAKAIYLAPIKD